jgi:ABC-type transport system involved in cytochrome bd biosynthesis fused ATPase/permease subunit
MVNSPVFYAAIITLWLVAFLGFLNISHAPGIVNVMSLVMTAAPSLFILRSVEAILKDQGAQ